MSNKKSFVFYNSYGDVFRELSGDQAKRLILAMVDLSKTGEVKNLSNDPGLGLVWALISDQIIRDTEKYEAKSAAGRKGGRPKETTKAPEKQAKSTRKAHAGDNDNENDDVNDDDNADVDENVNDNALPSPAPADISSPAETKRVADALPDETVISDTPFETFWNLYPRKEGKRYACSAFTTAMIRDTPEAIIAGLRKVIDLRWSKYPPEEQDFIPKAEKWLKGLSWQDDVKPYVPKKNTKRKDVLPEYYDPNPDRASSGEKMSAEELAEMKDLLQQIRRK